MKDVNYVQIRVFSKPEDDVNLIEKTLLKILPEKSKIDKKNVSGFNERKIIIFESELNNKSKIKLFLNNIFSNLNSEQIDLILNKLKYRINENKFNLRLEKKDLLNENYFITNYGDCFNIVIGFANYPGKTMEERVKEFIEGFKKI